MSHLIGILGGGQLARMLALAGHPLGMRFRILDPAPNAPASPVAEHISAEYTDKAALNQFCQDLSVITCEFENVPAACVEHLSSHVHERVPIYPPPLALRTGQDRLLEKQLFRSLGIPVAKFADIESAADLERAAAAIGLPAILKTRRMGYDGKGQLRLQPGDDLAAAYAALSPAPSAPTPLILEEFIPFDAEASILAVRSPAGEIRTWPLVRNDHSSGILRRSRAPFRAFASDLPLPDTALLETQAILAATRILDALAYVGVLAVEFFVKDATLIASEIAPRVHNSGHWTIEGSVTSQFENHLRAVLGLPLGDTSMPFDHAAAVMHNLVGGWPDSARCGSPLAIPGCHLHLYGKSPRPGRKVGHATIVAPSDRIGPLAERLAAAADAHWRT